MKKFLFLLNILLCTLFAASSCSNTADTTDIIDTIDISDTNYPTTISRLPEETILQMRNDFAQRNPTMISTINQFGFCWPSEEMINASVSSGSFAEEEAIEAIKEFIGHNPETGITDPENLHFKRISRGDDSNNATTWVITTEDQLINEIEVYKSNIAFNILNRSLRFCNGHYFPNVYMPEKINFDIERAKSQLLGKEVIHLGFAGQYSLGKITKKHLQECETNLIVVPLRTEEKIELRVAWKINLLTMYYVYYVDVMTGEIVHEESTVIS